MKTQELSRYILGKSDSLDFKDPMRKIDEDDSKELRKMITSMTSSEARKLGINKSTLWYLKKHSHSKKPLRIHKKIINKFENSNNRVRLVYE